MTTKTYYVIRRGWNAANQSSVGTRRNPRSERGLTREIRSFSEVEE